MKAKNKTSAFLWLIVFLVPLLLACFLLNRIHLKDQGGADPRWSGNKDILILGDSHTAFALDPEILGRAVNFSSYGESYIHNYHKLKYALARAPAIQMVILPIDLHSFSDFRKDRIHFTPYWYRYLNYIQLGWRKKKILTYGLNYLKLALFEFRGKYSWLYRKMFNPRAAPSTAPGHGFTPQEGFFFHNQKKKARFRASRQLEGFDPFSREMVDYFKRILEICQRYDIEIILLKLPISRAYYKVASRFVHVPGFYHKIFTLARRYPRIHSFDFQKYFFGNESVLFWDPQHLNRTGARRISTLIRDRINSLGLR